MVIIYLWYVGTMYGKCYYGTYTTFSPLRVCACLSSAPIPAPAIPHSPSSWVDGTELRTKASDASAPCRRLVHAERAAKRAKQLRRRPPPPRPRPLSHLPPPQRSSVGASARAYTPHSSAASAAFAGSAQRSSDKSTASEIVVALSLAPARAAPPQRHVAPVAAHRLPGKT